MGLCVAVVALGACSGGDDVVRGVVIDVQGDLDDITEFTVRLPDGSDRSFQPARGILFHGGASLAHLQEHLRTGNPVDVRFRERAGNIDEALEVADAGASS